MQSRIIVVGALIAALIGGHAAAQIAGSPHDLASGIAANEDKNEICVYCHTPHGAAADAPLWNKPLVTTTFNTYDSTTIDGVSLEVGSVSIACLTCHDGSQAVDAVINAPGTGLGDGNIADGLTTLTGVANLGGATFDDLTNDHPIGIQYGGFAPGGTQIDPDFENDAGALADNAAAGSAKRWWVDTEASPNGTREKTDMILYTRENGVGNFEPFVECASCHDPHEGASDDILAGVNSPGSDISFMRIANTNSDVCLACHTK